MQITLSWYFSKMETPTLCLEVTFWLVKNITSIHDKELLTTSVGFSIISLYSVDGVRESISWRVELVMSFFLYLEQQVLKSPMIIECIGNSSFMWLRSTPKFSNSLRFWLGERRIQVKKTFFILRTNYSN